jgi:hypothetical protein
MRGAHAPRGITQALPSDSQVHDRHYKVSPRHIDRGEGNDVLDGRPRDATYGCQPERVSLGTVAAAKVKGTPDADPHHLPPFLPGGHVTGGRIVSSPAVARRLRR